MAVYCDTSHGFLSSLPRSATYYKCNQQKNINSMLFSKPGKSSFRTISRAEFEADAATAVIDSILFPLSQQGERSKLGMDAQEVYSGELLDAHDPRLERTYAEFPLNSFDELIERGMSALIKNEVKTNIKNEGEMDPATLELMLKYQIDNQPYDEYGNKRRHLVDLGSGCGRLVLYAGLTGCRHGKGWNIHGIEISDLLHSAAINATKLGIKDGFFYDIDDQPENVEEIFADGTSTKIELYCGPATDFKEVLEKASIIFAYSTVWPASDFSPDIGAYILDSEWSTLLANACNDGCVIITTDRALNPDDGFQIVDRLDVDNPNLAGSTGFVHILNKK